MKEDNEDNMDIKNVRNLFQKAYKENKGAMTSDDPNELKKVLEGENIALTDEQLDYVAGGFSYDDNSEAADFLESYGVPSLDN